MIGSGRSVTLSMVITADWRQTIYESSILGCVLSPDN